MAEKTNIFSEDWDEFHEIAVNLRHLLTLLPWQLKMADNATQRTLDHLARQGNKNKFGAASGLSIIDVFRKRSRVDFTYRAPLGKRDTSGERIQIVMEEVKARFNNSIIVSMHEILEKYVKAIYGKMLYQHRNEQTLPNKKAFHAALGENGKRQKGTLPYYQNYANWECRRNCKKAFKFFEKTFDWTLVLQPDWNGVSWPHVAELLSNCRNIIVHADGEVSSETLAKLSRPERDILEATLRVSELTHQQTILLNKDMARHFLEAAATVGYICYYLASKKTENAFRL